MSKEVYNDFNIEMLESFLNDITKDSNISELFDKITVKDLGNGLYQIGKGLITGRKGLEEFDKVMRDSVNKLKLETNEQ